MALPLLFGAAGIFKVSVAWFVLNVLNKIIFRVMFALGIGLITYQSTTFLTDFLLSNVASSFGDLPVNVQGILHRVRLHECISMIVSAYIYRFSITAGRAFIGSRS